MLHLPKLPISKDKSELFSMGKIRQEYQAVRKWYIEQNKKLTVLH